jgi:molybdate transport system substrate-binding protein
MGASGCGGASDKPVLVVSAAASLQKSFTAYAQQFSAATARFSFAGSDALAAQIQQGLRPDVFAAANTTLPSMLYAKNLVEKPVAFSANKLVLAVPASSREIAGLAGVERPGVTLSIGTATVPVGAYTQTVLLRLPAAQRRALLMNVKDTEPDVTGIIGKLTEGAADAGFLYATDVAATGGRLRAIPLPAALEPRVLYGAAVVRGTKHPVQARAFIAGLLRGAGQRDLRDAGFLAPPGR